jgi:hypothetical protein
LTQEQAEAKVGLNKHKYTSSSRHFLKRCFGATYIAYLLQKLRVPEDKGIHFMKIDAGWTHGYLRMKDWPRVIIKLFQRRGEKETAVTVTEEETAVTEGMSKSTIALIVTYSVILVGGIIGAVWYGFTRKSPRRARRARRARR